jgi:hypothetical protein
MGHFVVIHEGKKDAAVFAGPARGVETLSGDEFCRRWTGGRRLAVP